MADDQASGLRFPAGSDGHRSTSATGRALFADAARAVNADLASAIEHTSTWRTGYIPALRDVVIAESASPSAAYAVAEAGLASAHRRFRARSNNDDISVHLWMGQRGESVGSVDVIGREAPAEGLSVPYAGRLLQGDHLRRQVDAWVDRGIAEPGFAEAIHTVIDNPDWLQLHGQTFAILGAGAEMAPTRALLRWGATVQAIDLARPAPWLSLIAATRASAGRLRIPIVAGPDGQFPFTVEGVVHPQDDDIIAGAAGLNLLTQAPAAARWLSAIDEPFVLGTYAYADGAAHALLSMAADAIISAIHDHGKDPALAFLATPTDVFMVPIEVVAMAQHAWDVRGLAGLVQRPLRLLGQFTPNYPDVYLTPADRAVGFNDSLVSQQGPNYALAKRLQRWRAVHSRARGSVVSMNLAPATRTTSVVRNRALAAAYAGAGRFGVEVFDPDTSSTLMAAMLIHDLRNAESVAQPGTALDSPLDQFSACALHGGLWRSAYAPRSVMTIAALTGMVDRRS